MTHGSILNKRRYPYTAKIQVNLMTKLSFISQIDLPQICTARALRLFQGLQGRSYRLTFDNSEDGKWCWALQDGRIIKMF